jgi:hypothetical protein
MVIAYWIVGNILQSGFAWLLVRSGLLEPELANWVGLIVGWGLLFVVSLIYRESLDDWLRA